MSSFVSSRRVVASLDGPSTSGRFEDVRRVPGRSPLCKPAGMTRFRGAARDLLAPPASALPATGDPVRPPAGPSTVLCSSLGKERKKLAKVLKSHRKVLEKRLSALTRAEMDAPVLSELLSEIRQLSSRLESQRAINLMRYDMDDSDSSDSDDEECSTRSAASLCSARRSALAASAAATTTSTTHTMERSTTSPAAPAGPAGDTMVVSTMTGQIEVAVPAPPEGWLWDEEEFRAAKFEGAGGRVMVCTGSKCQRKGATEVLRAVSALSEGNPNIEVVPCKCVGKCSAGAALRVRQAGLPCATYTEVRPAQLRDVFQEHFVAAAAAVPEPAPAPAAVVCSQEVGTGHVPATVTCCVECQQS